MVVVSSLLRSAKTLGTIHKALLVLSDDILFCGNNVRGKGAHLRYQEQYSCRNIGAALPASNHDLMV